MPAPPVFTHRRSPKWTKVRKQHLREHPRCELCGTESDLEVHHIEPFHRRPELELVPENLITLCEKSQDPDMLGLNCHLCVGHLGDWSSINPRVKKLCAKLRPVIQRAGHAAPRTEQFPRDTP